MKRIFFSLFTFVFIGTIIFFKPFDATFHTNAEIEKGKQEVLTSFDHNPTFRGLSVLATLGIFAFVHRVNSPEHS